MKRSVQYTLVVYLSSTLIHVCAQAMPPSLETCLPADIKLGEIVEATGRGFASGVASGVKKVTVKQKLVELEATCNKDSKLVDGNGRQIVFYHLTGCWGNPPNGYEEILRKQQAEINKLKEQYTIIEMTCNPSGAPIS